LEVAILLQPFINKPIRVLPFALALTAMQCVSSKSPLTDLDEGFLDEALLGTWTGVGAGEDQLDETGWIQIGIDDSGSMSVLVSPGSVCDSPSDQPSSELYLGHSSSLRGSTYLNLRFARCISGQPDKGITDFLEQCPFFIVRYATENRFGALRHELTESGYSLPMLESLESDMVAFVLDSSNIDEAIEDRIVEGEASTKCITAEGTALRRFFRQHGTEIFDSDQWNVVVRVAANANAPTKSQ
jgi:hypothetical protein